MNSISKSKIIDPSSILRLYEKILMIKYIEKKTNFTQKQIAIKVGGSD